jgi:hypothetical protein
MVVRMPAYITLRLGAPRRAKTAASCRADPPADEATELLEGLSTRATTTEAAVGMGWSTEGARVCAMGPIAATAEELPSGQTTRTNMQ